MPTTLLIHRSFLPWLLLLTFCCSGVAEAQSPSYPGLDELPGYSARGADTCLSCHDEDPQVMAIFQTAHGSYHDPRSPMANLQCEACHGPGGAHTARVRRGATRPSMPAFAKGSPMPRLQTSEVCLGCHSAIGRTHAEWAGSTHQRNGVVCVDCHRVHAVHDPVRATVDQAEVCYPCHAEVRVQAARPFAHPVREGLMSCSQCHQPHGAMTDAMLLRPTLNETCYGCHAEKRGPVLWEHAPVTESCAHCHVPHGSLHPGMLTRRAPLLCQSCHSRAGHPSIAQTGTGLPSGVPSAMLLVGSCLNCHAQVHGSNHPSGANLSR
jgi:DmsE family decaheme c-type cytochrome